MKRTILMLALLLMVASLFAQSEKFTKAMEKNIAMLDDSSSMKPEPLQDLANTFERIGEAEKTQWLPYYYAAYCNVMKGFMMNNGQSMGGLADKTDPLADKAEALLAKAEALTKENSEIFCVKKMIATLRMMADPMTRYATQLPLAAAALQKAKELDQNNPRIYLLEGQDKFYTPEQFGGSKTEAKVLFEEAIKKYEAFKPESSIHPQWGLAATRYFHAECSK